MNLLAIPSLFRDWNVSLINIVLTAGYWSVMIRPEAAMCNNRLVTSPPWLHHFKAMLGLTLLWDNVLKRREIEVL